MAVSKETLNSISAPEQLVILRLYSPLEPYFDKSWRPSEVEPI
jgi:hypothetical protein